MAKLEVLVFVAQWCGACKMAKPVIEELILELGNDEEVKILLIDVQENQDLALQHQVRSIPTMVFVKESKELDRIVGRREKEEIRAKISALKK